MVAYALTIFTGAFLLFQVQPLIGKYILPWFGGGPGVWTTCMLFFQGLLLGGYAYAHFSSRWLKPRMQATLHLLLLLASLLLLPITPAPTWKPRGGEDPTLQILGLLAVTIGLPYFVLSATGPLLQHWFSRTRPGASPYRLFALSNTGSLLALISFPLFFETHFTRQMQATLWAGGLTLFVLANSYCAWKLWNHKDPAPAQGQAGESPPVSNRKQTVPGAKPCSWAQKLFWLLLPACASVLLLATTNKLCQDVAVIPFLWVLPLGLYLLSFIICFDNPRWYVRAPFSLASIVAVGLTCRLLFEGTDAALTKQILTYSSMLFLCCMVCHGELYRLKPEPSQLTGFYLAIAAGGALGGFFVAVLAPLIFANYYELHWGLLAAAVLMLLLWIREGRKSPDDHQNSSTQWIWMACALTVLAFAGLDRLLVVIGRGDDASLKQSIQGVRVGLWLLLILWAASWLLRKQFRPFRPWRGLACVWLFLAILTLGGALWEQARTSNKESIVTSRNFYGVLTVFEYQKDTPRGHYLLLQHGGITHGLQFMHPDLAKWATTYYGPGSGIAKAFAVLPKAGKRIGVVGLGTGTLTAFAQAGDYMRIYEINPEVIRLAESKFTYLSNCPAQVEIALGDARLSMEREPEQRFDLLALDAFSSDAIPVHLLTRQAFELYQRHMKTNGVIAVHVSNHYLDLEPVVVNLAREFNYKLTVIDYDEEEDGEEWWFYSSTWLLLTHDQALFERPEIRQAARPVKTKPIPLWTDDFASLFQIISN